MNLFDVYPLFDITPAQAQGSWLWDDKGEKYLDLYGGHAVISIGHSHPHYVKTLGDQLSKIAFYSNSVQNPLQVKLAEKLGRLSGYPDYQLFLCNSGAEANENALKVASFLTGRKKIIAFTKAFHGRTSGAVAATDNPKIVSPFNADHHVAFVSQHRGPFAFLVQWISRPDSHLVGHQERGLVGGEIVGRHQRVGPLLSIVEVVLPSQG